MQLYIITVKMKDASTVLQFGVCQSHQSAKAFI